MDNTKICYNCMKPVTVRGKCPNCGYVEDGAVDIHYLIPGSCLRGRYMVGKSIGTGGFGITYIGKDILLDMNVAIKEYFPFGYAMRDSTSSSNVFISTTEDEAVVSDAREQFLKEAKAVAQFHGTNGIVDVRDFFEENNTAYIIMDYLNGQTLKSILKKRTFGADEIFNLMTPIFKALKVVHDGNIVHRDISPDNIMMLSTENLVLMDFGIARKFNLDGERSVSVALKKAYAPVEQYNPHGKQGPWTDIYALCGTIYHCITGNKPISALDRLENDEMKWPSELGISIRPEQEAVLKKGLAINIKDRIQNIDELLAMLQDEDITVRMPTEAANVTVAASDKRVERQPIDNGQKKKIPIFLGIIAAVAIFAIILLANKDKIWSHPDPATPSAVIKSDSASQFVGDDVSEESDIEEGKPDLDHSDITESEDEPIEHSENMVESTEEEFIDPSIVYNTIDLAFRDLNVGGCAPDVKLTVIVRDSDGNQEQIFKGSISEQKTVRYEAGKYTKLEIHYEMSDGYHISGTTISSSVVVYDISSFNSNDFIDWLVEK